MRLLLLHTGGTLMMRGGVTAPLAPDVYTRDLLGELPVLRKIAEIETRILFNLDSSDIQPHHWVTLARAVHEALARKADPFAGVVVVHGTDTMAYTASALAFLLPAIDRPVILTGSVSPLTEIRSDARTNLVDACHLATMRVPEVAICFDSKLLRGCRATKLDAWGTSAFGSPSSAPLAELGTFVSLAPHLLPPRPLGAFDGRIEPRVFALRTFPGLSPALLESALGAGAAGLVLEAFGAGNVPRLDNSLVPVIEAATGRDVPVVVVSQCARGAVELGRYEGGAAAARAGAVGAFDMTPEAALAKLMVTLGRAGPGEARVALARAAFSEAPVGEMTLEAAQARGASG